MNSSSKGSHSDFLNGDEAVAYGAKLCRPHVIAVYPITPQTIVVEKLSEFVANNLMNCEFIHVESEHSAMCAAMGRLSWVPGLSPPPPPRASPICMRCFTM